MFSIQCVTSGSKSTKTVAFRLGNKATFLSANLEIGICKDDEKCGFLTHAEKNFG